MEDTKKIVMRFAAGTLAVAVLYVGTRSISKDVLSASADFHPPPAIVLTNNQTAIPGAVSTTAFVRNTAEEFAAEFFEDAEEDPSLDEFLKIFFCNACSRHCLLITPRCVAGRLRNTQATEIYMEMFPHMEVFGR